MKDERPHLGGTFAVYPGHPITLAYLISLEYASFKAASAKTAVNPAHALGNSNIPGAGGNVHAALNLLYRVKQQGWSLDKAFEYADKYWSNCDNQEDYFKERWLEGQAQADKVKEQLRERLQTWS